MPKIIRKYYTWQNLLRDLKILARKLAKFKFDYIVAVSRGGLIPATILGYLLKIKKIQTIGFSHYVADGQKGKLTRTSAPHRSVRNAKVLLVDDVVDSGLTTQKAVADLKKRGNKVTTAVIHYKGRNNPAIRPDYFVKDPGKIWVVYPWEPRTKSRRKVI